GGTFLKLVVRCQDLTIALRCFLVSSDHSCLVSGLSFGCALRGPVWIGAQCAQLARAGSAPVTTPTEAAKVSAATKANRRIIRIAPPFRDVSVQQTDIRQSETVTSAKCRVNHAPNILWIAGLGTAVRPPATIRSRHVFEFARARRP